MKNLLKPSLLHVFLAIVSLILLLSLYSCFERDETNDIKANFTADKLSVNIAEEIQFTDLSSGNPSSWAWEFPGGNPSTSTDQNPIVTYTEEGQKSVVLTVSNGVNSDVLQKTNFITVDIDPQIGLFAEFTVDKNEVEINEEVQFTDRSNGASSWQWEFPGGNPESSTEQNPIVTYSTVGLKSVTLTVSDGENTSTTEESEIINVITPQLTEAELIAKYNSVLDDLKSFIQYTYLFDAVLTNQYELTGDWSDIYNHTYSPTSSKVEKLWNDGFQILDDITLVYSNIPNISDQTTQDLYRSRCIMISTYVRNIQLNYFGYIPFYGPLLDEGLSWKTALLATIEDSDLVNYDIAIQANALPEFDSGYGYVEYGSEVTFTDIFRQVILMRYGPVSISGMDPRDPFDVTEDFNTVAGAVYIDGPYNEIFDNAWRRENILGFEIDSDSEFNSYFTIGDYVPIVRASEAVFIYLESYLRQTNSNEIIGDEVHEVNDFEAIYNILANDHGYDPLPFPSITSGEILELLFDLWKEEFRYEGKTFQVLKRFDVARSELGIESYQELMPIPQSAIDANENIAQNPGY